MNPADVFDDKKNVFEYLRGRFHGKGRKVAFVDVSKLLNENGEMLRNEMEKICNNAIMKNENGAIVYLMSDYVMKSIQKKKDNLVKT